MRNDCCLLRSSRLIPVQLFPLKQHLSSFPQRRQDAKKTLTFWVRRSNFDPQSFFASWRLCGKLLSRMSNQKIRHSLPRHNTTADGVSKLEIALGFFVTFLD